MKTILLILASDLIMVDLAGAVDRILADGEHFKARVTALANPYQYTSVTSAKKTIPQYKFQSFTKTDFIAALKSGVDDPPSIFSLLCSSLESEQPNSFCPTSTEYQSPQSLQNRATSR